MPKKTTYTSNHTQALVKAYARKFNFNQIVVLKKNSIFSDLINTKQTKNRFSHNQNALAINMSLIDTIIFPVEH
jgi:hypothetical protein